MGPRTVYGEEKNLLPLPGIEPRHIGRLARSLVDVPFVTVYVPLSSI
jgi:hypothetical protein